MQENRCFRVGLDCSAGCIGDYVNNHRPVMARVISVVMMETTISVAGLDKLEKHAGEVGNVEVILMTMSIREIRELKSMLEAKL